MIVNDDDDLLEGDGGEEAGTRKGRRKMRYASIGRREV